MYIVTGGAGFIGSNLISLLNSNGINDIIIVDNLNTSEKWKNLVDKKYTSYIHKDKFRKQLKNDNLPPEIANNKIKAIIHLGASSSTTETNMDYLMENNVEYSKEIAIAAIKGNIRFIYASSAATYGNGEQGFDDQIDIDKLQPLNRYGYSKHLFDLWAKKKGHLDKICGLKFFNVYGANEDHKGSQKSVFYKAYQQIKEEGSVKLFKSTISKYTNGEQQRDFVYVKDCTKVIWQLIQKPEVNGIFNLGTGKARSWNDLAKSSFSALKKEPKIEYIDMPQSLAKHYQNFTEAKIDKLKNADINCDFHSLESGAKDLILNYLEKYN